MSLQAEGEFLLLEVIQENVTPGGIHLPDNAKNPNLAKCKVLSVGSGWYTMSGTRLTLPYKVGQIVYVQPNPREFQVEGGKYALISFREIMLTTGHECVVSLK